MIQLYDSENIEEISWPDTEEAKQAKDLLVPMLKEGVASYIQNVKTDLYLLAIENRIIPITVNHKEYDNSYLTSNYFPIKYAEEKLSQKYPRTFLIGCSLIRTVGLLLKLLKINKSIVVNNWLLPTNIYPALNKAHLEAITDFISKRFPDHMIIFRSLNERDCVSVKSDLKDLDYRILNSRAVFFYDPEKKGEFSSKVSYHHRRDRRLIDQEGYEVATLHELKDNEMDRILELYNEIYLSKHTKYSPQYTKKYLKQAIEKGFFKMISLKKEGKIQGVMGVSIRNKTMIIPFFGYNTEKGSSNHLYRMMTILAIEEAEKAHVLLNDGSGGEGPKKYRGMRPFQEYVALYVNHLPFFRRKIWILAEKIVRKFTAPLIDNDPEKQ